MFPLPSTVNIAPPDRFFAYFGKKLVPSHTYTPTFPHETIPGSYCLRPDPARSHTRPRPETGVQVTCQAGGNFDHCHNRQLGCCRASGWLLDMSNRRARHVEVPSPLDRVSGDSSNPRARSGALGHDSIGDRPVGCTSRLLETPGEPQADRDNRLTRGTILVEGGGGSWLELDELAIIAGVGLCVGRFILVRLESGMMQSRSRESYLRLQQGDR